MPDLKIIIGADNSQANAALKSTQSELVKTEGVAKKLGESLGGKFTKGSDQATQALTNLGRVAQDAPFGFMGIANNLNPLLESFQRLQKETGSVGLSLKALGASLLGAGGIGFALSAFQFFALGGADAIKKLFQSASQNEALDKAKKSIEEYKKAVESIYSQSAKEATQATALVAILKNETETRERKNQALKELKQINPEIFGQLKLEGDAVAGLDNAYKKYLENFKLVIAAKITQAKLEKAITTLLDLQGVATTTNQKKFTDFLQKFNKERANSLRSIGGNQYADDLEKIQAAIDKTNVQKLQAANDEVDRLAKELEGFSKGIELSFDKSAQKTEKHKTTITDVLQQLSREFDYLNAKAQLPEFGDQTPAKIQAILSTVERLIKDFKVNPDDTIIQKLLGFSQLGSQAGLPANLPGVHGLQLRQRVFEKLKSSIGDKPIDIVIPLNPKITIPNIQKVAKTVELKLGAYFQDAAANIGITFGETLGNALTGFTDLGDFFKSMFSQIGAGLKQLGAYLVKTALTILIAKKTLTSNPYLAAAAGITLIAIGTALQNSISKKKAFALGGRVPGTGNSDSVDAILTPGEYVLRKSVVQQIGPRNLDLINSGRLPMASIGAGSQQLQVAVTGVVRGKDIYFSNARYVQGRDRTT